MRSKALIVTTFLFLMLCASLAHAQATRTWVSGVGDDANPCSRTAPCKTFAGAISKTASGGEINALDPGGYGAVTITKPMTIDGGGMLASSINSAVNGFIINSPGANDTIILRNLEIFGAGAGLRGVHILAAKNVILENVNIYRQGGSPGIGINIATTAANVNVSLHNVSITNNAAQGVQCSPTAGNVRLVIDHSRIEQNTSEGVNLVANCKAVISNSSFAFNGTGVASRAATTDANIATSTISFHNQGVFAQSSTIWLYATRMNHNNFPQITIGGDIRTHANNAIVNNTDPTLPTPNVGQQ